jgi:predicted nucleotidyltransferase
VWRELDNLERLGLLTSEGEANIKYYALNPDFAIYEELRRIVLKTTGLGDILREALSRLGRIRWAFVYGSVARGEEDALSDVDLILVGEADLMALSQVVARQEERLGREINYTVLAETELSQRIQEGDPFLTDVLDGAKIMLIGDEDELRRTVAAGAD